MVPSTSIEAAHAPGLPRYTPPHAGGITLVCPTGDTALAKPNYSFDKRQREIAKKKQQEEKDARKREARDAARQAADATDDTAPREPSTPAS